MRYTSAILWSMTALAAMQWPVGLEAAAPKKAVKPAVSQTSINQALVNVNTYIALQQGVKVQDIALAGAMKKALTAADLLILSNGTLDTASCPLVKAAFISAKPQEWEMNMGQVLDRLTDPSWQPFFAAVKAPSPSNQTAILALKAMFGLSPSQSVSDRHAKVAVLAAMLSPYNQGPVGDCFAVASVIREHEEYFQYAAKDYASIAMNGYLSRPVNGSVDAFFFLPILADEDLTQPCTLNVNGTFPNTSYSLLSAPGFAAACQVMGGQNLSALTQGIMRILGTQAQGGVVQTTPADVIAAMAQVLSTQIPNGSADALCKVGQYAFSSLTNNTILRGVESAFAAMAEDRPNDSTRGNINQALAQALQEVWQQMGNLPGSSTFQQIFTNTFNASCRLVYNLNVPLPQLAADGSSSSGAFQLYRRDRDNFSALGTPVATPQDFQQLVLNAIEQTALQLGSTQGIQTIANQLASEVRTNDFLANVLWNYDSANLRNANPVADYQKLYRTPMQSPDGDNPYAVDDINTGTAYDNHVQVYTPSNARDLITWCLNLAKNAPKELIPMNSPQHAFNFAPINPDLLTFVQKGKTPSQWLQTALITPGIQISRKQISAATQKQLTNTMYSMIADALPNSIGYQQLLHNLSARPLCVRDYASGLLQGINRLLQSDADLAQQVATILDAVLLESLPQSDQAVLNRSAIRFAFTNWNQGIQNIYFCAYFNPRTEQIGFGNIFENKTNLQPMNEAEWVNNQPWDVDMSSFTTQNG